MTTKTLVGTLLFGLTAIFVSCKGDPKSTAYYQKDKVYDGFAGELDSIVMNSYIAPVYGVGKEILTRRTTYHFDAKGYLIQQEIIDHNGTWRRIDTERDENSLVKTIIQKTKQAGEEMVMTLESRADNKEIWLIEQSDRPIGYNKRKRIVEYTATSKKTIDLDDEGNLTDSYSELVFDKEGFLIRQIIKNYTSTFVTEYKNNKQGFLKSWIAYEVDDESYSSSRARSRYETEYEYFAADSLGNWTLRHAIYPEERQIAEVIYYYKK